jgi:DNA-binding MurR/RpiR family transcriptional regulator
MDHTVKGFLGGFMTELTEWLDAKVGQKQPTTKQSAILAILRTRPREVSYGSVTDLGRLTGFSPSSVTRTAQLLGYDGWTEFQTEYRGRYLAALSAVEVAAHHESVSAPTADRALQADRQALADFANAVDQDEFARAAEMVAAARTTWVLAGGSYAVAALAFEHNTAIAGYDVRRLSADVASLSNSLAKMTRDDVLVAFSVWRPYESTLRAIALAREMGMGLVLVTDDPSSVEPQADDVIITVPSEGAGFFPSLVPALSVAQALAVEVSTQDRALSRKAIARSEQTWDALGVVKRRG